MGTSSAISPVIESLAVAYFSPRSALQNHFAAPGSAIRADTPRRGSDMDITPAILLLASTLAFAAPLIFAAIGELISEKAGVINIELDGMMLSGAFCGVWAALSFGQSISGFYWRGHWRRACCARSRRTLFGIPR